MSYPQWHRQVFKKIQPLSEMSLYVRSGVFGLLVFASTYLYTSYLKIPGTINKSVADTSIILIGLSMLLSSICYFWNFLDSKIIYRKHLGLVGLAFGIVHIGLSFPALKNLFVMDTWTKGVFWAPLTGAVATVIFLIMALVSNQYSAMHLGGVVWRKILRTGYIAMGLVLAHVIFLKFSRWLTWYQEGAKTLPAMSIVVSVFILFVLIMRVLLWWSLKRKSSQSK